MAPSMQNLTLAERIARLNAMTASEREALMIETMTAEEIALIGSPCDSCSKPLSILEVRSGCTCFACQELLVTGTRVPAALTVMMVFLPILAR